MPLAVHTEEVRTPNHREYHIRGSYNVGALGAVGALFGRGFTVTHGLAGTYVVTVATDYNGTLISTTQSINRPAAGDAGFAVFARHADYATLRTITLFVRDAADLAVDPANGVNIAFDFTMLSSTA